MQTPTPYLTQARLDRAATFLAATESATVTFFLAGGICIHLADIVPSTPGSIEGHTPDGDDLVSFCPNAVIGMQLGLSALDSASQDEDSMLELHGRREELIAELRAAARAADGDLIGESLAALDRLEAEAEPLFRANHDLRFSNHDSVRAEGNAQSAPSIDTESGSSTPKTSMRHPRSKRITR